MDTKKLLEYLKIVIDLEKNIYIQKNVISNLNNNIASYKTEFDNNIMLNNQVEKESNLNNIPVSKSGKILMFFMIYYLGYLGSSLGFLCNKITHIKTISILIGIIGAIVGGCIPIVVWINIMKKRKQQAYIDAQQNLSINKDLAQNRVVRNENIRVIMPRLEKEKQAMLETNQLACSTLNQYYNLNIIPLKYRNINAVCKFYEYISNGRTYSIVRNSYDEGAINMYEHALEYEKIESKLNTIINNLEDIKYNQKLLYNEIRDGNNITHSLLRSINNNVTQINKNMEVIQYQNDQRNHYLSYMSNITYQRYMS